MSEHIHVWDEDVLGTRIKAGDRVVYAAAEGRSSVLRSGIVLSIEPYDKATASDKHVGMVSRIKVRPDTDTYVRPAYFDKNGRKDVTLHFPRRMVVIPNVARIRNVNEELRHSVWQARTLLDDAYNKEIE